MKVGLFNECFPPIQDGVSQVVENYARVMHAHGEEVSVVTAKIPFFDYEQPYAVRNFLSIPVSPRLPYRVGLPIWMAPFQPIMKYQADIFHVHSPFTSARIALHLAKKNHTPVIATFHSKYRDDFRRSVPSEKVVDWMIHHIMQVYEAADEVWIPQPAVLDVMRSYGYKGKAEVVPNAIDFKVTDADRIALRAQARKQFGVPDHVPCFLFVGQITREKRVDYILNALRLLADKGIDFRMFYVGKGYHTQELEAQIKTYHLENQVKCVGLIQDRTTLQLYYAASDLFIFPSLYDTFAIVVREAAIHGVPSIITEDSTIAPTIEDGVNGYLAPNKTPEDLASTIEKILANEPHMRQIGQQAAHTLGMTWEDLVPEVLDRYQHLIDRKK